MGGRSGKADAALLSQCGLPHGEEFLSVSMSVVLVRDVLLRISESHVLSSKAIDVRVHR